MKLSSILNRMKLWKKLAVLALGLLLPALSFGYLYVSGAQKALATAEQERRGADYLQALSSVLAPISRHRGLTGAYLNGDVSFRERARATQAEVEKAITAMDEMDARFAKSLAIGGKWAQIREHWHSLKERALTLKSAEESFALHSALLKEISALSDAAVDSSELSVDPFLSTYYLQSLAFSLAPDALDSLAALRGKATSAAAKGAAPPELRADLYALRDVIPWHLAKMQTDLERLWAADPSLRAASGPMKQQLDAATRAFTDLVYNQMLKSEGTLGITASQAFEQGDKPPTALLGLIANLKTDLVRQLEERQSSLAWERNATLAMVFVALGLVCVFAWVITRSITHPLSHAISTFASIANGKYDNVVELAGTDEAGQVLQALDTMQSKLRTQIELDRAQAAVNSRLKSALDASSACVVVTDHQLDITYTNHAAERLFRGAQDDFRREIASFDANRIVGMNMEAFQRHSGDKQLAGLTSAQTNDMRIGSRNLRLVSTPVITADADRIGTVFEWLDRTQECNAEEEVGVIVKKALEGDLSPRVRLDDKSGFFEVLGRGLNELLENTAAMVRQIQGAAVEVHRGADEISQGNANLSQRTEEQSSSLEETASSMEQMTSTVKQNADNAGQANQLAVAARDQAEKGGAVTGQAMRAMTTINEASRKIADITGVINEIAFQTNLLALNAAVEAARAGEQGRGFAVVASEVRSLAGRSATAAKEIKALIEDSVKKVEEGSHLVTQSGRSLDQIVASIKKVSDIVAEIAAASREQSSGIEQVNKAVMQMDEMTQQNAALVEEASAASHSMAEQARSLSQMMARYQLGEATSRVLPPQPVTFLMAPAAQRSPRHATC